MTTRLPTDGYISTPYFHHPDKKCRKCKTRPARLSKKTKYGSYCPACQSELDREKNDPKGYKKSHADERNVKSNMEVAYGNYHLKATMMRIEREQEEMIRNGQDPRIAEFAAVESLIA